MCAIADWYRAHFSDDADVEHAASKIMHKIEKLKSVGDGTALKELTTLPWETQSTLTRISVVRGLWSVTRVYEFRPYFVDLRDRVHASFVQEFGQERADHLLRGLYNPEFHVSFRDKLYAVQESETY